MAPDRPRAATPLVDETSAASERLPWWGYAYLAALLGLVVAVVLTGRYPEPASVGLFGGAGILLVAGLTLAYYLIENHAYVVRIRDIEDAHPVTEVLSVPALMFVPLPHLIVARVLGAGIWYVTNRKPVFKILVSLVLPAAEVAGPLLAAHLAISELGAPELGAAVWWPVLTLGVIIASLLAQASVSGLIRAMWHEAIPLIPRGSLIVVTVSAVTGGLAGALLQVYPVLFLSAVPAAIGLTWMTRAWTTMSQRYRSVTVTNRMLRRVTGAARAKDVLASGVAEVHEILHPAATIGVLWDDDRVDQHILGTFDRHDLLPADAGDEQWRPWLAEPTVQRATLRGDSVWLADLAPGAIDVLVGPLHDQEDVIGVVVAVATTTQPGHRFESGDQDLFTSAVEQLSLSLRNRRLLGELERQARIDPLTGLGNRMALLDGLFGQDTGTFTVALLEIDNLARVVDALGPRAGDEAVQAVAERVRTSEHLRHPVYRYTDTRFASLVPASIADGELGDLLDDLHRPVEVLGIPWQPEIVVGVADVADHPETDELLRRAEVALRADGMAGRIRHYTADDDVASPEQLLLASQLRTAIQEGQLSVLYQPQIDLPNLEVVGLEALVRWDHPQLGTLTPDRFLPLAEHERLMPALTDAVADRVFTDVEQWPELHVSMNLSAWDILDPDIATRFGALAERRGVDPGRICLEVTEGTLMADLRAAGAHLSELRSLGFAIALDDFGTGYSSLQYVARLPITELKIDKAFVQQLGTSHSNSAVVTAAASLARSLELGVVAEGVENERQLIDLHRLEVGRVQGFYFARPMRLVDLTSFLTNWPDSEVHLRAELAMVDGPGDMEHLVGH